MNWEEVYNWIAPYIVRVQTPTGHGTGFLFSIFPNGSPLAIATAWHVVDHAHLWKEPIKLWHYSSGQEFYIPGDQVNIIPEPAVDGASIILNSGLLPFPSFPPKLFAENPHDIGIGGELAWVGFPAIASNSLCFFTGNVSTRLHAERSFLIDGVSIPGVSGGPVIYNHKINGAQIVGMVTEYHPNRHLGQSLPGLVLARDMSHFVNIDSHIKSLPLLPES